MHEVTADLQQRIEVAFGARKGDTRIPRHSLLFEALVVDRQGPRPVRRRIDAVAVSHRDDWLIHGFEIKATRDDYLLERKRPEKSAAGWAQVDRWWLVARNEHVVAGHSPPETWGLLVPDYTTRGLTEVIAAEPAGGQRDPEFVNMLLARGFTMGDCHAGRRHARDAVQDGRPQALHAALAISLGRPITWSNAALIGDLQKRLPRHDPAPLAPPRAAPQPVLFDVGGAA